VFYGIIGFFTDNAIYRLFYRYSYLSAFLPIFLFIGFFADNICFLIVKGYF
jgi:hypothetical protein